MKLINTNRFFLPGTNKKYLHLATVQDSIREFMCFANVVTQQIYIEEITGGRGPDLIEDQSLAEALAEFLTRKGVLLIDRPLLPDSKWLRPPSSS